MRRLANEHNRRAADQGPSGKRSLLTTTMPPSLEGIPINTIASLSVSPMGGGMGSAHSPVKSHSTKTFKISFTSEGGKTSDIMALPTLTGDHDDEPTPNSKPEVAVHAHPSVAEHVNDLKGLMASGADAASVELGSTGRSKRAKVADALARSFIAAGATLDMMTLMKVHLPDAFPTIGDDLTPETTWAVRTPMKPHEKDGGMFVTTLENLHRTRGISGLQLYCVFAPSRNSFKLTTRMAWHVKTRDANEDSEQVGDACAGGTAKKQGDWLELFKDE